MITVKTVEFNRRREEELKKNQVEIQRLQDQKTKDEEIRTKLENEKKDLEAKLQAKAKTQVRVASSYKAVSMSEEEALNWIISHEGGPTSVNKSSLACGLAQSLPCSKILSYAGVDMSKYNLKTYEGVKAAISTVPVEVQRAWMIDYCIRRYKSVAGAQQAWLRQGWY